MTNKEKLERIKSIVSIWSMRPRPDSEEGKAWEKGARKGFSWGLEEAKLQEKSFQARVKPWLDACFGHEIATDKIERNHRFLEEALELVQSTGCTQSEAHQLVDYVFNRQTGEKNQETGGVMVTLAALCLANEINMHECAETELARVSTKENIEKIRAKQKAKPKHSPLPQKTDDWVNEIGIENNSVTTSTSSSVPSKVDAWVSSFGGEAVMSRKTHVLKTVATVWDAVASGEKRFEVRLNDRFFQHGDVVTLRKLDADGRHYAPNPLRPERYSTCDISFTIGWMLQGGQFGIDPRYVVFQLEAIAQDATAASDPQTERIADLQAEVERLKEVATNGAREAYTRAANYIRRCFSGVGGEQTYQSVKNNVANRIAAMGQSISSPVSTSKHETDDVELVDAYDQAWRWVNSASDQHREFAQKDHIEARAAILRRLAKHRSDFTAAQRQIADLQATLDNVAQHRIALPETIRRSAPPQTSEPNNKEEYKQKEDEVKQRIMHIIKTYTPKTYNMKISHTPGLVMSEDDHKVYNGSYTSDSYYRDLAENLFKEFTSFKDS